MNPLWKQLQDKINKDQLEAKKLPSKAPIYPTQNINEIQNKPIKIKTKPPSLIIPTETGETKNYDMASFICSLLIDGELNGCVIRINYKNLFFFRFLKISQIILLFQKYK